MKMIVYKSEPMKKENSIYTERKFWFGIITITTLISGLFLSIGYALFG